MCMEFYYLLSKLSLILSSNSWPSLLHRLRADLCLTCCPPGFPGPFPVKLLPMLNRFPSQEGEFIVSLLLKKDSLVTHFQSYHQTKSLKVAPRHAQEGPPSLPDTFNPENGNRGHPNPSVHGKELNDSITVIHNTLFGAHRLTHTGHCWEHQ